MQHDLPGNEQCCTLTIHVNKRCIRFYMTFITALSEHSISGPPHRPHESGGIYSMEEEGIWERFHKKGEVLSSAFFVYSKIESKKNVQID